MKLHKFIFFYLIILFVFPLTLHADTLEDAKAAIDNNKYKKAYKLLNSIAEDNAEAQTRLGALYINGQGVEMDFNKGLSLIMKAATSGYKPAKLTAFKLYMDLGNQGDTAAMYNAGYMCLKGWGGEPDTDTCLRWLENAGVMGHEKSAKILSRIYSEGMFGITPDEGKADYWNNLQEAFATGLDGKWEGSIPMGTGGQTRDVSYEFKTDGDILSGTTVGFGGVKIPLEEGKIDGNKFSFKVKSSFGGMKNTTSYTGEFFGDTIKLTSTTETSRGRSLQSSKRIRRSDGGETPPVSFTAKRIE